jgi:hypothetical protein
MVVSASFSSARGCAIYYRQSRHVVRDTLIRLFSELRSGGSVPDHSWSGYEETGGGLTFLQHLSCNQALQAGLLLPAAHAICWQRLAGRGQPIKSQKDVATEFRPAS